MICGLTSSINKLSLMNLSLSLINVFCVRNWWCFSKWCRLSTAVDRLTRWQRGRWPSPQRNVTDTSEVKNNCLSRGAGRALFSFRVSNGRGTDAHFCIRADEHQADVRPVLELRTFYGSATSIIGVYVSARTLRALWCFCPQ